MYERGGILNQLIVGGDGHIQVCNQHLLPVLITRSVFDPITTGKNVEEDWAGAVLLPGVFALLSTVVGGG